MPEILPSLKDHVSGCVRQVIVCSLALGGVAACNHKQSISEKKVQS